MTDDIESCFRAVLEVLPKCDLQATEVIAWYAEMLKRDRALRGLRQQFEASRSP